MGNDYESNGQHFSSTFFFAKSIRYRSQHGALRFRSERKVAGRVSFNRGAALCFGCKNKGYIRFAAIKIAARRRTPREIHAGLTQAPRMLSKIVR